MEIMDGHSHLYQKHATVDKLKKTVNDIEGFDIEQLLKRLDEMGVSQLQTMSQSMERIRGMWLGSNALSVALHEAAPSRIVSFAAAEPLDARDRLNEPQLEELEDLVKNRGIKGLLLTPGYGHYYANDKRIYPFYRKAIELDIPIYFHHSHQFGPPRNCPLKYCQVTLLDDLTIDFPELRFDVEHMGYPWTEELLCIMARSPNVYTDFAMYIEPYFGRGRRLLLVRNLAMAREYGVLDRVFYGSDYVGESVDEYIDLLRREIAYIKEGLNNDLTAQGFAPLAPAEIQGFLADNVLRLWQAR
jgi:predicted TIM-barrel fold metal-dependent hydrolase